MNLSIQVLVLLTLAGVSLSSPQNRRPAPRQPVQQQQQQQEQFTKRFDPNANDNQDFYQPKGQQQAAQPEPQPQSAQPRVSQNFSPQQDFRREATTFIPIIRFDNQHTGDGGYKSIWETGNNILAEETGTLKKFGNSKDNTDAVVQQGSYSYTSPEGQLINVHYTADENGFRATGDHLPTPPPVPLEIQKGLDIIYAGIAEQQRQGGPSYSEEEGQYNPQQNQPSNINFRPSGNNNRGFRQ